MIAFLRDGCPRGAYPQAPIQTHSEQDSTLDLKLEYYDQENAGFLRVTVTKDALTFDSFSVPFDGSFQNIVRDTVTVTPDGRLSGGPPQGDAPRPAGPQRRRR